MIIIIIIIKENIKYIIIIIIIIKENIKYIIIIIIIIIIKENIK